MSATLASTVEPFLVELERSSIKPATVRAYRRELRAAAFELRIPLEHLSREELERWVSRNNAAPGTVARRRAMLRRIFNWAVESRRCLQNPLEFPPSRTVRHPTAQERTVLDAALFRAPMPYRLAFVLLSETELRIKELLTLTLGDVCIVSGHESLRVRSRAGHGTQLVLLGRIATPRSLRLLQSAMHTHGPDDARQPLLHGPRGAVSYAALRYQWHRLCLRTGLIDQIGRARYTMQQLGLAREHDFGSRYSRSAAAQQGNPTVIRPHLPAGRSALPSDRENIQENR